MTLDEFITLEKINLEKFRMHHARGVKQFEWPTDMSQVNWKKHYNKWWQLWEQWKRECGIE